MVRFSFGVPVNALTSRAEKTLAGRFHSRSRKRFQSENQSKHWRKQYKYRAWSQAARVRATPARLRDRRTPVARSIPPDLETRRPHEGGCC